MVSVHLVVGVAVIVVCAAAAVLGFVAYRRRRVGAAVSHALVLTQTVLIGQALLGLFLVSDGRRASERMHYAYGAFAIGVALAPWLYAPESGPRRLLWFAGTSLLAGVLALRAFQTA
jgi:heme A synthase